MSDWVASETPMVPAKPAAPRWPWLLAIRPKTLPAALTPVVVGAAVAIRDLKLAGTLDAATVAGPAVAAGAGALLLQVGANLANDYFDHKNGTDTEHRLGPPRAAQQGWISPRALAIGTAITFGLATLVGAYLATIGGWPIVAIGVASIACALLYTGGPLPYGYVGLGDLFVFVFFGLVAVMGTYYIMAGTVALSAGLAAIPIGALVTAILVVNNLRDRQTDAATNKRTLAVMLGATATRVEYLLLMAVAYAVPVAAWAANVGTLGWLMPLASLPVAMWHVHAIWNLDGAALNPLLGGTARLGLIFGLLFSVGILL